VLYHPAQREGERGSFYGRSSMQAAYLGRSRGNRSLELAAEEILMGNYTVKRKNYPLRAQPDMTIHTCISAKTARRSRMWPDILSTICNDGNKALGPIFLQDLFPQGSQLHQLHLAAQPS